MPSSAIVLVAALLGACIDPPPEHRRPAPPIVAASPVRGPAPARTTPAVAATRPASPIAVRRGVTAALCAASIATIERNPHRGSSITFRLVLAGGARAAFKPDQAAGQSRFRAELAAYRLSERLGYGRVPPSCERSLPVADLLAAAGSDDAWRERLVAELRAGPDGLVAGAAIAWVEGIRPLPVSPDEIRGHALEPALSDMILFDELVGNWDRWSGGNVFTDASARALVLIDNAAAFGRIGPPRRARMDRALDAATAPTEGMLTALRHLTLPQVERALGEFGYDRAVAADVIGRRDRMLARRSPRDAGAAAR